MKNNPIAKSRASLALMTLLLLCFSLPSLRAEVFGLFTYRVVGGTTVEITDYPTSATGPVVIPAQIDGKPVTSIGSYAFYNCTGLTSVTIPNSVTSIGEWAFFNCAALTSIAVDPLNPSYVALDGVLFNKSLTILLQYPNTKAGSYTIPSSVTLIHSGAFYRCTGLTSIAVDPLNPSYAGLDGVLFNKSLTILLQCPGGKAGSYTIPSSVTSIGEYAFAGCNGLTSVIIPASVTSIGNYAFAPCTGLTSVIIPSSVTFINDGTFALCTGLTSVTIPSSVTYIGESAFYGCTGLIRVAFLGNAPWFGLDAFGATPVTFYYLSGRTGWTTPTWYGRPATMINQATWPAASWLLTHGFWYDTNLQQDPNGDGVSLLTAYALNLNPHLNLQGSLPKPVLGVNTLGLGFHAASPGITYTVQTSTNLQSWTTQGVVQSAPGPDGRATATVLRDAPSRFLRLVVQD